MRALLGIDIGTTGTKAALFREDGTRVASAIQSYGLKNPAVGRSEQDPQDWWQAVVQTVRAVCAESGCGAQVTALSLSLQGGTLLAVDRNFAPLRPAIVWNDTRASCQAAQFAEVFGAKAMYEKTGWALAPGMNAIQILWLRAHEPEAFEKAHLFMSVGDYIAYRLTGCAVTDPSSAGISQLLNVRTGQYDPEILAFLGIDETRLPVLGVSGRPIGQLTPQAAQALGLNPQAVLVAGAHDQYAVAVGAGCVHPGDVLIGTGTAWVAVSMADGPRFSTGMSQSRSAVPGLWGSMTAISAGGVCLEWLRSQFGAFGTLPDYQTLDDGAGKSGPGARGVSFFPYFGGQKFPVQDERVKAAILGLDLSHNPFDLTRAVLEGVAYHVVWVLEGMGSNAQAVKMTGGAAKSRLWRQIVADIAGRSIDVPAAADTACTGAAILAGVGCGVFQDAAQGYAQLGGPVHTVEPSAQTQAYRALFPIYKAQARRLGAFYCAD